MSQPPPYVRSFDYTQHSADFPADPQPGTSLDADFNAIATTFGAILANLALIQRDDGKLANQIVTLDSISPQALMTLGAGSQWRPRGVWVAATVYAVSDVVTSGTATYVCAVAHTAGVFATDAAAGKWLKIFDSSGSIPSDGSVTTPKIADGAVTGPKVGFTALDLSGSVRAATGVRAGTAPFGRLLHVKGATGDVVASAERTTDAQGAVGYRWAGVALWWEAVLAANSNSLAFTRTGLPHTTLESYGLNTAGSLQALGPAPTACDGVSLSFAGLTGTLRAYNSDTNTWRALSLQGSIVSVYAQSINTATFTPTGLQLKVGTSVYGATIDAPTSATNPAIRARIGPASEAAYIQFTDNSGTTELGAMYHDGSNLNIVSSVGLLLLDGQVPVSITSATLSSPGELGLSNGYIEKWGVAFANADSSASVVFATAFPNACFNVQLTPIDTVVGGGSVQASSAVALVGRTGFTIYNDGAARNHYWRAIGN